ncbi:MAG: pyridoxamine 5'-phosphate oxidase family protein [Chloroflexi bacterium]|nr:pyridoxamine 5'-phosphate oxidase family protein [Chloroflexota bacterium]
MPHHTSIDAKYQDFISKQHVFFVATAAADGRVNLSPKGMDSMHVVDENKVVWLNVTGSGNETAAHLLESDRMTLMFCSFDANPLILRLYGRARAIYPGQPGWDLYVGLFPPQVGARQIFEMDVDLVQNSCGFAVPRYDYMEERPTLVRLHEQEGVEGLEVYRRENNLISIDGKPTGQLLSQSQ